MVQKKYKRTTELTVDEAKEIRKEFSEIIGDIVNNAWRIDETSFVMSIYGEKYFLRNSSTAGSAVNIVQLPNKCSATITVMGAGTGLLNFSFGATGRYMELLEEVLLGHSFEITDL